MSENGTPVYAREHKRGLTLEQQNTVDLLAGAKNDTQTAALLSLSRTTVTKWRLYDPEFQTALNWRRAEVWGSALDRLDRLRALIPKALDVLEASLNCNYAPRQVKAAAEVLRLARLPSPAVGIGLTDAEEIVRRVVSQRRQEAQSLVERITEERQGLPPLEQHLAETWDGLKALAHAPDDLGETLPQ